MDREPATDAAPLELAPGSQSGDRRVLPVLFLAMFLAVINFAALSPFFPEVARDLGTSVPLLGQVVTVVTLLSAFLGLGIGPLADRYGYRRLVVGGMFAVACNLIGTALAPSYPALLVLAVVGGLGDAILFGLPLAIAGTRFAGAARRRALARTSAAIPAATVAGVPLLAAIGGGVGWRLAVAGAGAASLGAAWLATIWLPADPSRLLDPLRVRALLAAYRPLLRHRPLLRLYAVSGLRAACWVGPLAYLGAFLADERDLGAEGIATAYAAAGLGVLVGNLAVAGRLGRAPLRPLVAGATAAQGVFFGAVFVLPLGPAATVGALVPTAFVGAIAFVGVATLLVEETPAGVATTMVLNGSVFNLGTAAGGAVGGVLIALGGYAAFGLALPIIAAAAAALAWAPARSSHDEPTARQQPGA